MKTVPRSSRLVRRGAIVLAGTAALLSSAALVQAQEITGRLTGRVTDQTTHAPLGGVTVILQGQQGEAATLTDDHGDYLFVDLAVGTYVVRFYNANSTTNVERGDLSISAAATLRADAAIPTEGGSHETYVIQKKAAAVDVGSARLGLTINEEYMTNIPLDRTFGDLILKAPGAFLESSGDVSIAGASGLENVYVMDGLNVTGMEYGDIMNKRSDASGGSNLTLDFVKELQVSTGGYRAEFGGAMGGVVNVVTKSGSNEFHGSAFLYWSPYWMAGEAKEITHSNSVLVGSDHPDYDTNVGFELGGPIIKNKLFFWVGFAPRLEKSHYFRDVDAEVLDPTAGGAKPGATDLVLRTRTPELRQSYQIGAKIDYLVSPDDKLTIGFFETPTAQRHVRSLGGEEAVNDPMWAVESLHKTNTDLMINWMSQFLDHRLRIDAGLGLHRETYSDQSPYGELNNINQLEWHGASLYNLEPNVTGCAPQSYTDAATNTSKSFDPCPVVDNGAGYHTGGFGQVKSFTGNRYMADLKATGVINHNEIKVGVHAELNTFDQTRYYTGPIGQRDLIQFFPSNGQIDVWNFFSLPRNSYPSQFDPSKGGMPTVLADPNQPYYQDQLTADVKSLNTAYFAQDSIHPLPNLTIDLGVRYENQKMYDYRGDEFMNLDNIGPRLGVVYDPSNDGRSKIFAHYGQFYETIPMNLAARYFGGEGILARAYDPTMCTTPPTQFKGTGNEFQTCPFLGTGFINAGGQYPVQPNIQGQYHNEVVAGVRHALTPDLVVGIDYTHRWLGSIIEDGTADPNFQFALGNPGDVPQSALDQVQKDINTQQMVVNSTTNPGQKEIYQAQLDDLKTKLNNLKVLGSEPKPERTYDAVTLSAVKRLSRRWLFQASYTYSRLIGNYNGLYDADVNYFAPNGSNAYDTADLILNKRGPLANDRPHSGHVDGFYQLPVGARGTLTMGLSFTAYSGVPRNYVAALIPGQQLVFLLPRGAAGRTPTVTQTDAKLSYRRELSKTTALEAFIDLFNIFDRRTALSLDDNYTFDSAAAIVNGTTNDLKYAKNSAGTPIQKNPNFGQPTSFQTPITGRLGVRLMF